MEDDELTQLTLLDAEYAQKAAEMWERERRQVKVGRPRKGEERPKAQDDGGGGEGSVSAPGGRMRGATGTGSAKRDPGYASSRYHQEDIPFAPTFDVDALTGSRVARQTVVAALRRALGRIRNPERWTPLHLAASRKEHQADLCWWGRWPPPDSPNAVKWSAEGAIVATTPDQQVQRLAVAALGRGISTVEREVGHAATLQYLERRIESVAGIAAEYVTRRDILEAVARLPTGGREREEDDD